MKYSASSIICALATATSVLASPSPAKLEARATASSSGSLPTVTVQGNAFFANGKRFYIRGIDYQPGGSSDAEDPLASQSGCDRDIPQFKKLGLNTIRVYTVDNTADHDYCMNKLAAAGIYVALDVNTPKYSINRGDPGPSYNPTYLQSIFATMDAFSAYSNTLLFFSGNEVINSVDTTNSAPYVKAVTRDMKQYRDSRGMRSIPIGYSAADVAENRFQLASYLNCGPEAQRSDFFAFNDYAWCSPSSFTQSGWSTNVQTFGNYSIPLFLSEFGCITNTRTFEEIASLYSTQMTSVYSGGLVYEYSMEGNGYGVVTISGNSVSPYKEQFSDLMSALAKTPAPSGDGGYKSSGSPATCPSANDRDFDTGDFTGEDLPAIPSGAVQYFQKGAGKGPGLAGAGSQDAGGASTGTADPSAAAATVFATQSASATHKGAASGPIAPLPYASLCTVGIMLASVFVGAAFL